MLNITTFDDPSAERFDREYERVFYQCDYKAMAAVYTEDATLMIEDSSAIQGRQAIEQFWKRACERAKSVSLKRSIRHEKLESSGDLAYRRGTVMLAIPSADGEPVTHVVKYVTVWKREADGTWRIAVDISNRNAPLDPGQHTYGVAIDDRAKT